MNWIEDNLALFLPEYLSSESQRVLIDAIKQFPDNLDNRLYSSQCLAEQNALQGDGIQALTLGHTHSRQFIELPCMLISNSCDMDLSNQGIRTGVCYAPIFRLDKYEKLVSSELGEERAKSYMYSLRQQQVTQCMYLPRGGGLEHEGIVMFDQIVNSPNSDSFQRRIQDRKMFRLSQYGFYLLLFKLSVHFTRMGEAVDRDMLGNCV